MCGRPAMPWGSPALPRHRCRVGVPQPHRSPPAPEVLGCVSPTALTPLPHSPGFPSDPAGVSVPQILPWPQGSVPHGYSPAHTPIPLVPQGSSGYLSSANTFVPPGTWRLSPPHPPLALAVSRIMRSLPHVPCGPSTQVPRYP